VSSKLVLPREELLIFAVIILQMFIAVINENFHVAEEAKKGRQASHYWAAQQPEKSRETWLHKLNPYTWFNPSPKAIAVENLPSNLVLPMQKALVQNYGMPKREGSRKKVGFSIIYVSPVNEIGVRPV
jgi:voltage-dependent calcium channel